MKDAMITGNNEEADVMWYPKQQERLVAPSADSPSVARAQGMLQALRWQQTNVLTPQEEQRVRDAIEQLTAFVGSTGTGAPA